MSEIQVTSNNNIEQEEISLKELVLKIKEYASEFIKNWYILALFIVLFISIFLYIALTTKPTYNAQLTFIVNDDGGNSLGLSAALGSLADFGDGSKSKFDQIIELSKSRKIIQTALFRQDEINGIQDLYANHLIRTFKLHKAWEEDTTGLRNFLFKKTNPDSFSRNENKVLLLLQAILVGKKPLFSGSYDKRSEILRFSLVTTNEELSIKLLKVIYADLSTYYVEKATAKEERTYKIFRAKSDSLRDILRRKDVSADRYEDKNRGSLFLEDKREVDRMKKEAYIYNTLYAETEKNMNIAGFALESKVPYIQDIDMPIAPITPDKKSILFALIIGFVLGFFVGSIAIIGRKVFKGSI